MSRTASGSVAWRGNPARWWARVTTHDEQGNVRRPWVDLERPDLRNTPEDKKIARRLASKRAKLASKKTYVGPERATAPKVTVADLEDKWFALLDGSADMKPATRAAHKSCWRANIKPKLGARSVADLTVPALRAWLRELRAEVSTSTVRNNAASLTRFFADVKAEHWAPITVNPMRDEDVRSEIPAMASPEPDAIEHWTRDAFEKLVAVPSLPDVWFGLYLVAVTTGMRDGELHGLQFKHVQSDASVPHLRIRQQLGMAREGDPPTLGAPKTKYGKRDLPMHPSAAAWLAWWKTDGWKAYVGRGPEADDFVFPQGAGESPGEPWRPNSSKKLREHLDAADLPKDFVSPDGERSPFTWHAIRHTFATWLGHNGVDGELVDRLLGQSPRSVRGRHYQAPSLAPLAAAVATLELTLPKRAGVAYIAAPSPPESSRQLSQAAVDAGVTDEEEEYNQSVRHPSSGVEQRFRKP
jgi:integrase